jgi:hypothetical protein
MADRGRRKVRTTVAAYAAAAVLGVLAGLVSLYLALGQIIATGTVQVGPWRTNPAIGSPSASPYLRAAISLAAVLALASKEALYFFAFTDSDGAPLTARCSYTIEGPEPQVRWWSITAYRRNGYLPETTSGRASLNARSVSHRPDATFTAAIAGVGSPAGPGDIAFAEDTGFNLLLRLYGARPDVAGDLPRAMLPAIRRTVCR